MGVGIAPKVRRVFVVNSVVNPFIYGVARAMFREDVSSTGRLALSCLTGYQGSYSYTIIGVIIVYRSVTVNGNT